MNNIIIKNHEAHLENLRKTFNRPIIALNDGDEPYMDFDSHKNGWSRLIEIGNAFITTHEFDYTVVIHCSTLVIGGKVMVTISEEFGPENTRVGMFATEIELLEKDHVEMKINQAIALAWLELNK